MRAANNQSLIALLTDDATSVSAIDVQTRAPGIVKAGSSFDHVGRHVGGADDREDLAVLPDPVA